MASKADLLKKNANKTGKGLFAGMTPIKEESNAIFEKKEEPITEANNEKINSVASRTEEIKTTEELNEKPKEEVIEKKTEPSPKEMVEDIIRQNTAQSVKKEPKGEKTEKTSRYEKEKFLLLDIRGLRDYVEHMAKAANMSATKYIRSLIEQDMSENMDIYEAHKA